MEILNQVKALNFFKKLLLGETARILPFEAVPQKGHCPAYSGVRLKRATPEQEGISSSVINDFIKKLDANPLAGLHTIMIVRGDKVVTEASWAPYSTSKWHVTHSMCKSVTGTAIGMLCDEGLLSLNDKICDIFPDKCSLLTSRRAKQITVEHLITMSSGASFKELGALTDSDWTKAFLDSEITFEPGTKFDYNSMNSYMLSAIVTRKAGVNLSEYLRTRLFEPLDFGPLLWEACPMGNSKGGWGLYVFLEDLLKLGILYKNIGVYNGKQIISKEWANKAVSSIKLRETGEEYGYHIWASTKHNCFMFNGMFGQYVAVFPNKNIIIAMNAGNGHLFTQSYALDAMCEFANAINNFEPLNESISAQKDLSNTISKLCATKKPNINITNEKDSWIKKLFIKKQIMPIIPEKIAQYANKQYKLKKNTAGLLPILLQCISNSFALGIDSVELEVSSNLVYLIWQEGGIKTRILLNFACPAISQIKLNGHIWDIGTTSTFTTDEDDNDVLKISLAFLESSSTRLIKIVFYNNGIELKIDESPAIALAMEKVQEEHIYLSKVDPAFFKDIDYVEYKFTKFCAPTIKSI